MIRKLIAGAATGAVLVLAGSAPGASTAPAAFTGDFTFSHNRYISEFALGPSHVAWVESVGSASTPHLPQRLYYAPLQRTGEANGTRIADYESYILGVAVGSRYIVAAGGSRLLIFDTQNGRTTWLPRPQPVRYPQLDGDHLVWVEEFTANGKGGHVVYFLDLSRTPWTPQNLGGATGVRICADIAGAGDTVNVAALWNTRNTNFQLRITRLQWRSSGNYWRREGSWPLQFPARFPTLAQGNAQLDCPRIDGNRVSLRVYPGGATDDQRWYAEASPNQGALANVLHFTSAEAVSTFDFSSLLTAWIVKDGQRWSLFAPGLGGRMVTQNPPTYLRGIRVSGNRVAFVQERSPASTGQLPTSFLLVGRVT